MRVGLSISELSFVGSGVEGVKGTCCWASLLVVVFAFCDVTEVRPVATLYQQYFGFLF